jgi:hypothetical protein
LTFVVVTLVIMAVMVMVVVVVVVVVVIMHVLLARVPRLANFYIFGGLTGRLSKGFQLRVFLSRCG